MALFSTGSSSPFRRPSFLTPLTREDVLESGQAFPREELLLRVLSFFWRDCCFPPGFSRGPAPVVELTSDGGGAPSPGRAWWLLNDGIVEDVEGPHSERIRLFFGGVGRTGQLWPRYEFQVLGEPPTVALSFFERPLVGHGLRVCLEAATTDALRVRTRERWWGR